MSGFGKGALWLVSERGHYGWYRKGGHCGWYQKGSIVVVSEGENCGCIRRGALCLVSERGGGHIASGFKKAYMVSGFEKGGYCISFNRLGTGSLILEKGIL